MLRALDDIADSPDLEDVVIRTICIVEVADAGMSVVGFNGGLAGGVPDDHDMADLVGSEVGVPEDQVAWSFLARSDPGAVAGGEPVALRGGNTGHLDTDLRIRGLGEAGAVPGVRAGGSHPIGVAIVAFRPGENLADAIMVDRRQVGVAGSWPQSLGSPGTVPPP